MQHPVFQEEEEQPPINTLISKEMLDKDIPT